ncbi:MAG: Nif3-like dinuclear metal center hexameric protein [Oscillospiraceae bacterium]|nr:Nif3-like dinuclear metal center hexameric protein [Oscillospiraceae bacterium]MBQ7130314.1 Nif3-like dinuclear metal center hexameric protein [Oscillospiraceae bacterium]
MATAADILNFVESLAPRYMKCDWDNVGLLCGRRDREVKKILVALDPFRSVIAEAIEIGADCIVTHHPLIFRNPLMAVNEDTEAGQCVLTLIEHGIVAINAHTNFDLAPGGINDVLARTLGLSDIEVIHPEGEDAEGRPYGLLRCGTIDEISLKAFLAGVKAHLNCDGLRYVDAGKPVRKVAVGGGSCADEMAEALAAGCDTFVTADVKYNQFRTAFELGLNLIDAGHFHTENPAMPVLAEKLKAAFPDTEVIFSENHADCMNFFV